MPRAERPERPCAAQSFAAVFHRALLNPEDETPSLLTGPGNKAAVRRYNVHRNNVTVSLINALAEIFPATQRLTGPDFFRAMARSHIRSIPPTSPLLFEYGHDFPDFIARYEYARSLPWLPDIARIERAWLDAFHAADASPLTADELASIPQSRLADIVFVPHPATRIVRSQFSALTIFSANRGSVTRGPIIANEPEDALITRPEFEVFARRLPGGGAVFLSRLMSGDTFGEAAFAGLQSDASFDLAANIAGLMEAGAFTNVVLNP